MANEWIVVSPQVNAEAEFWEIANDFGSPLELLREAISNSIDAGAKWVRITFSVEEIEGADTLVIEIEDNGAGMSFDVLTRDFWGLGFSQSRPDKDKIGEKGHGTKIYLRSERVSLRTQTESGACESECKHPMRSLVQRKSHSPRIREIPKFQENTGTDIRIEGYNKNEMATFVQRIVKDYLMWFTKVGSIERIFGIEKHADFKVHLKCLGSDGFDEIALGHPFPSENSNIQSLLDKLGTDGADWFVKKYQWKGHLEELPAVAYEAVIFVEGDQAKRKYNPMIRERSRSERGTYKVSDRYGIWLCKDFIPVDRVNEWIRGFGTGSNSFVLLHGFINCQTLKLTANRGSIANTDPKVVSELEKTVQGLVAEIDKDLNKNGLFTLLQWQAESRTLEQEKAEFERRSKNIGRKRTAKLEGRLLLEPQNEAELFGLLMTVYSLKPDIFEFEPLDYNTSRGIDIIGRNKTKTSVSETKFWYVELKYLLRGRFNHAFKNLRWIVCWNFDKDITENSEFNSIEEADVRQLKVHKDKSGHAIYFLDNPAQAHKIEVIPLKLYLKERLGIEFSEDKEW
jgi:hypothetical protein